MAAIDAQTDPAAVSRAVADPVAASPAGRERARPRRRLVSRSHSWSRVIAWNDVRSGAARAGNVLTWPPGADVAPAQDMRPGSWRSVLVDGTQIAVFNVNGSFHAIEDVCTHDGGMLTGAPSRAPRSFARVTAPGFPYSAARRSAAPACEPVAKFPVYASEKGMVQVKDDRWG